MPWREGLLDDQIRAAQHIGSHARLLAGPGTGKTRTLTRRVMALILEHHVSPQCILILTFTRVAAFELRQAIERTLQPLGIDTPRVSTLHSFALRQLLRNAHRVQTLAQPLRIADDWEERYIIQEDIKDRLQKSKVREIQELFAQLSADWETLRQDDPGWEAAFPDPFFLGAWREHAGIYGYTLRSELVYQLKRALNQYPDFDLEDDFQHVLVDEYQDLNPCDLQVIRELAARGCEIYAAGDDDQSIYGFRYAEPEGIRHFTSDYQPSEPLSLEICHRCDRSILRMAEFVASLDPDRLTKTTRPRDGADEGRTHLLSFTEQWQEAAGIASICQYLISVQHVSPDQILVLLRSDRHHFLSSVIKAALSTTVSVAEHSEGSPLDSDEGRLVLAVLRIMADREDNLAWKTALKLRRGIGPTSLRSVQDFARSNNLRFAAALCAIRDNPSLVSRAGNEIAKAVAQYEALLNEILGNPTSLADLLPRVTQRLISDSTQQEVVLSFLQSLALETRAGTVGDLAAALGASLDAAEQELSPGAVNILTMHKAKGLSADAVFIAGAEDEFLPGTNEDEREGDERRLLFVSMTRARHWLFITYCRRRVGKQAYLGRDSGESRRSLTRFLRDAPLRVENGPKFASGLNT